MLLTSVLCPLHRDRSLEGRSSIFAKAVLAAFGETNRLSFVCDSFAGLPPGDRSLDKRDKYWDSTTYLEVQSEVVASSFSQYGLLDSRASSTIRCKQVSHRLHVYLIVISLTEIYLHFSGRLFQNTSKNLLSWDLMRANSTYAIYYPLINKNISLLTSTLFHFKGDTYESTVEVLYNLYDKLSIGGFVIMDDVSLNLWTMQQCGKTSLSDQSLVG